ncbi:MAG: hypothetical protein IPM69_14200 [Ignavibacteria bacterium]|nr:hypothetical protein [Ignavibacteria bacterium]
MTVLLFSSLALCSRTKADAPMPEAATVEAAEPASEPNTGLDIGQIAPNFTQNDQNGKPMSLSDFRGK